MQSGWLFHRLLPPSSSTVTLEIPFSIFLLFPFKFSLLISNPLLCFYLRVFQSDRLIILRLPSAQWLPLLVLMNTGCSGNGYMRVFNTFSKRPDSNFPMIPHFYFPSF